MVLVTKVGTSRVAKGKGRNVGFFSKTRNVLLLIPVLIAGVCLQQFFVFQASLTSNGDGVDESKTSKDGITASKDGVSNFLGCLLQDGDKDPSVTTTVTVHQHHQNLSSVIAAYDEIDVFTMSLTPTVSFRSLPNFMFCRWRQKVVNDRTKGHWAPLPNVTARNKHTPVLLDVDLDCSGILHRNKFGTGNWVQSIYLLRHGIAGMTQKQRSSSPSSIMPKQVDLLVRCRDINATNERAAAEHVLPWLMGYYNSSLQPFITSEKDMNTCHADGTFNWLPISWALQQLRWELRRMAVAIVGIPPDDPTHPAHQMIRNMKHCKNYNQNVPQIGVDMSSSAVPLIPNVELDDVTIHFRCGDIMMSHYAYFRFLKFRAFSDRIDRDTKSIGIITQPFSKGSSTQARKQDVGNNERNLICQNVIYAFRDHLLEKFPNARVSIRNDKDETVGLAYARMVMSRQAFAAPDSSFSIYPALATFGKGYLMWPASTDKYFKNRWLATLIGKKNRDPQLVFMNETNFLPASATQVLNTSSNIIRWFQDPKMVAPKLKKK